MKKIIISNFFLFFGLLASAQEKNWVDVWNSSSNFYEIKNAFSKEFEGKDLSNIKGWKPYKRWEYYNESRSYPSGDLKSYNQSILDYRSNQSSKIQNQRTAISNWQMVGPSSVPSSGGAGRINNVRLIPGTTNQFVVATPGGGAWKYDGTAWSTSTDFLTRIGFADVAIHPTNSSIMYAASGDNDAGDAPAIGIFKSTNGGTSWTLSGLTSVSRFYRLIINPDNPNILIVSSTSGIYRSIDAGANWTLVSSESNIRDLEFMPGNTSIVYASKMSSNVIFFKSTDGGASFSNSGVGTGLPTSSNGRAMIAVTANDPNYLYMVIGNPSNNGFKGVYRSTDNGVSFTTQSTTPNLLGWSNTGGDTGGQQWYDLSIAVSPTNKDLVIVGGVNVWRSTDGGSNWQIAGHWTGSGAPYIHADIHDLNFDSNGLTVYAGCDGGIFKKDDITNSNSWIDLSNGMAIAQMYKMGQSTQSQNKVLTGWQDNGTNLWIGPNNWTRPIGGDGMESIIDYSSDTYQYGELYYGAIRKSTNGGASFSTIVNSGGTAGTVNEDGDWVTPYILNPKNPMSLYVGKTRIYKSTDRGASWTAHSLIGSASSNIDAIAVAPSDTNVIYTSKSGQIWRSGDNGSNYNEITAGLPGLFITYIAVDESNANKIFVTLSGSSNGNKVFQSLTGGGNWTNISTGLPNLSANCIVLDTTSSANAMYVGMDAGVYFKDDNSTSWTAFNNNLPNVEIAELEIQYAAQKIRAATYGRGLWEGNLESGSTSFLNAAFTSNNTNICKGSSVQYSDNSTGIPSPTSWSWSFPGGTPASSNVQHPLINYNTNGSHSVSLTVGNGTTFNTITTNNYVTVTSVIPTLLLAGDTAICAGSVATYIVGGNNLGTPTFTWTVNGVPTGVNASMYSSSILGNGSVIRCNVVSTAQCAQPTTTQSNSIILRVKPVPPKPIITAVFGLLTSSNSTGNQWMLNGSDITGAVQQTFNAITNGRYSVKTILDGCVSQSSDDIDLKIEGLFKVFPVPTNGNLTVAFYIPQNATRYSLKIFNALGQIVFNDVNSASAGVLQKQLDLKKLAAGIYHIEIITGDTKYKRTFNKLNY